MDSSSFDELYVELYFQVPVRWPASRDEVWKANIPHTSLAQEKSDQNWMVVNGDKINFPGGGTHFHNGADKYIVALSRVLLFLYDARLFFSGVLCYDCS